MKINQISTSNLYFGISKRERRQKKFEKIKLKRALKQKPIKEDFKIETGKDNTIIKTYLDGSREELSGFGSIKYFDSKGNFYKMVITEPDGHTRIFNRSCKIVKEIFPDKSYTIYDGHGRKLQEVYKNGFIRYYDNNNEVLYMHFPNGNERWGNGEIKQKVYEDGSVKGFMEDGTIAYIINSQDEKADE